MKSSLLKRFFKKKTTELRTEFYLSEIDPSFWESLPENSEERKRFIFFAKNESLGSMVKTIIAKDMMKFEIVETPKGPLFKATMYIL